MDLIIYHQSCPDGWCAAYICHLKYPEANFLPLNHGLLEKDLDFVFQVANGKDVIVVDYSLRTRELNDKLASVAKSLRILDHHKTAQAVLEGASYATFDMKRSGAGLAWDYLFGKDSPDFNAGHLLVDPFKDYRPWWVNYTEDLDLWNKVLPYSNEVNAFLMVQPRNTETWDKLVSAKVDEAIEKGFGVRSYIEYYTRSVVAEVQNGIININGTDYKTGVINIPYAGVSEAGAALVEQGYDIGLAWFERGDGITQFSLRSTKGGDVDVSALAKALGGGGHQSAAGFQVDIERGRAIVDSILGRKVRVPTPQRS